MGSKTTISLLFFLVFSSSFLFSSTLSRKLFVVQDDEQPGSGGSSGGDSLHCVQQLMPCKPYLKGSNPPATCCIPLKQAVANEPQCLCRVFQNQDLMKSFNVTLDDALALAASCGAHADMSVCKKVAAPSNSPAIPSPPSPPKASTTPPATAGSSTSSGISELAPRVGTFIIALALTVSLF
ncbi:hypothetical protein MLD38_038276 [Melastoma candidum]|uniref:Uncharacterized protein n=1 Tax=Melastoma candidum TaxID=119954 RepID=A0ACB9KYN4_9MYRT|nr:hypothetical protein MLD38_038276 [Melastoma candidum]